jgi:hypothetical protein
MLFWIGSHGNRNERHFEKCGRRLVADGHVFPPCSGVSS